MSGMRILKLLPRFRELNRVLSVMAEREGWSRASIESFQLARLNVLWSRSIIEVPFYRDLCARLRLPTTFTSLREFSALVPRTTKQHLRSRRLDLLSDRRASGRWRMTGGSTGAPTRVFWETSGHLEALRGKYRLYQAWEIEPLDPMVFLWGHAASLEPGLLGWLRRAEQAVYDRLRSRLRLSAYKTSREDLRRYLRKISKFQPKALYGYSTMVYLLAQEALAERHDLATIKAVFMTSEPILPAYREKVSCAFGTPAVAEYGSVECGFIAGEAADGTLRVREDLVIVETEKNSSDTFDILVTVLGNPSFPLIRYEIGDVSKEAMVKPSAGFAYLKDILGRSNDFIRSGTGKVIHPISFMDWLEGIVPSLGRYAIHQGADGGLTIEIESDACAAGQTWKECLRNRLTEFTEGLRIEIKIVEKLTLTSGGKHRFITSEVSCNS